jgi:branched-chain amino acid transport system permease protein
MFGAFIGLGVLNAFGGPLALSASAALVIVAMLLAAMIGCGALGVAIERVAYRPLRNAPRIAPLISALGVSFFLQSTALLVFGAEYRNYETYEFVDISRGIHVGPLHVSIIRVFVIVTTLVLMVSLTLFIAKTRLGKAMRATAYDREAAEMMGISIDRVILVTFFLGSALAGAAGVMVGMVFYQVFHLMGFTAGLKAFTAAVVGGIGSIPGAMLGGLLIGLAEALATGYLPQGSTFQDFWVFVLLIVVMLVRPTGLLGKPEIKKV